jgi:hypothetical protein
VLKGFLHVLSHPEPEAKIKKDQNGGKKKLLAGDRIHNTSLPSQLTNGTACFKKCKTIISIPTFTLTMRHVVIKALIYI